MNWKKINDRGDLAAGYGRWLARATGVGKDAAWMVETMAAIGGRGGFGLTPDEALANWAVENRDLAARLNALADLADDLSAGGVPGKD